MTTRILACTIALSCMLGSSVAMAESTSAARAFAKGKKLFGQRNYVEAVGAFEEAYRLRPHYMVQCSIARCYQNMNEFIAAARYYRRCLAEGAKRKRKAKRIRRALAAVKKKIVSLEVQSPGGGGVVVIDGQVVGRAPGKVSINPGRRVVEVRREGAQAASATIRAKVGAKMTITLVPKVMGGDSPAAPTAVPAPDAATDPLTTPSPEDPAPSRRGLSQVWFWAATGVTAALAATLIAVGVRTLGLQADYNDHPTKSALDDFEGSRTLTNVFIALTAVAAAGTTTLFFFTDFGGSTSREDDVARAPAWGIGLRGSF